MIAALEERVRVLESLAGQRNVRRERRRIELAEHHHRRGAATWDQTPWLTPELAAASRKVHQSSRAIAEQIALAWKGVEIEPRPKPVDMLESARVRLIGQIIDRVEDTAWSQPTIVDPSNLLDLPVESPIKLQDLLCDVCGGCCLGDPRCPHKRPL